MAYLQTLLTGGAFPGYFLKDAVSPEQVNAELDMREATGGANTHRGLFFLSAAFGRLYRRDEGPGMDDLPQLCARMTARPEEDFSRARKDGSAALSHGEALYIRCGVSGAFPLFWP
jgi:hypothetical protein